MSRVHGNLLALQVEAKMEITSEVEFTNYDKEFLKFPFGRTTISQKDLPLVIPAS